MRRSTVILGILVLASLVATVVAYWQATEKQRAWREFRGHWGKDLRSYDEEGHAKLERILAKLIPGRKPPRGGLLDIFDHRPYAVWTLQGNGQPTRVVLFEVQDTGSHPGSTGFRLTTFTEAGGFLKTSLFTTGHRTYMRAFDLKKVPVSKYPVLEVDTGLGPGPGANLGGHNPSRQVYALIDESWWLIRVEDDGQASAPTYSIRHFRCGPELQPTDVSSVENALDSPNSSEVLAILVWLGAFHKAAPAGEASPQYEDAQSAAFHREVRQHPSVIKRVEELKKSSDPWIRDAAALAQEQ